MKETIFRMMLQRQRGLWGCGELSRFAPSTLQLSPASSLSRELVVSNGSLPLCEAVETPQKRNVFRDPGLATSPQPYSPRTPSFSSHLIAFDAILSGMDGIWWKLKRIDCKSINFNNFAIVYLFYKYYYFLLCFLQF